MAELIIFNNPYDTDAALNNVVRYITDKEKSNGLVGAYNMLVNNPVEQITKVNNFFYNKTRKKVIHFILAFDDSEYISAYSLLEEGYNICRTLFFEYQVAFGVHQNTDNLHIHFALVPISMVTGKKFYFDNKNLYMIITGLRKIFKNYDIKISYCFKWNIELLSV